MAEIKEPSSASVKATGQKELSAILGEIEQRANDATRGPWEPWHEGLVIIPTTQKGVPGTIVFAASSWASEDKVTPEEFKNCVFAAASRTDVPALVKALRRAVEMLEWTMCRSEPGLLAHRKKEITAILTESDKASGDKILGK